MPSPNLFSRKLKVCSQVLTIDQKLAVDVNCVVWDAGLVLAKYSEVQCLQQKLSLERVNVVELGSGLGCVGLPAACLGANVVLIDLEEAMLLLEITNDSATAKVCSWADELSLDVKPDLILFADCVYYKEAVSLLIRTLQDVSSPITNILISQEERDTDVQRENCTSFIAMISRHFTITEIPLSVQHPLYRSRDIRMFRLKLL